MFKVKMEYEIREDEYGKYWYLNEKLHRENGPAIEYSDGHKEWWINGKRFSTIPMQKIR